MVFVSNNSVLQTHVQYRKWVSVLPSFVLLSLTPVVKTPHLQLLSLPRNLDKISGQNRSFKDKEDSTKRNEKIVRLIRYQVVLISNRYTCIKTNTRQDL